MKESKKARNTTAGATRVRVRPGPKRSLSRAVIIATALDLLDAEGVDAVSMRRVSGALGVQAMALYRYIGSKDELIRELVDHALGPIAETANPDGDWVDQVESAMRELYAVLRAHPGLIELFAAESISSPGIDRMRNRLLSLLRESGLPPRVAIDSLTVAYSYTTGIALVTRARTRDPGGEAARLEALPQAEFPALVEVSDDYRHRVSAEAFDFGLRTVMAGLRQTTATQVPSEPSGT